MTASKPWNWNLVGKKDRTYWQTPSAESYYLLHRWQQQGRRTLLDLGCGLGRHSILFAKGGFEVSAFDLSETAVAETEQWAQREHLSLSCKSGDMLALPYAPESFSCIFCRNVISHSDTAGVRKVFREAFRVLQPGGEFYFTLCSKNSWGFGQDWPVVDANTKIRVEDGPENGIPHFFADYDTIRELCATFQILTVQQIEDILTDGVPGGWHYHVLVKKPD